MKTLKNLFAAVVQREVAKCVTTVSNWLGAIEAASSWVAPSVTLKSRNATSKVNADKNAKSGVGSSSFGGFQ